MIGQTFHCGKAQIEVQKAVGRCAAINVDPKTARRSDKDLVRLMKKKFGHSNLGVFAKVIKGGEKTGCNATDLIFHAIVTIKP